MGTKYEVQDDVLRFGNTADAADKQLTVQSKKKTTVYLEADTDNSVETDVPQIWMSTDAGQNSNRISIDGNDLVFDTGGTYANSGSIIWRVGMTTNDPGTGTIPTITVAAPTAMSLSYVTKKLSTVFGLQTDLIEENTGGTGVTIDGVLVQDGGIKLLSTGATPSLLDFYATETFAMSFTSTIFSTPLAVTFRLIRVGGQVTITWPRATKSMSGGSASASLSSTTFLPAAYRPSDNDIQFVLNGVDNDVITQLQGIITTTGQIRIGIAPNELNNFTFNAVTNAGIYESSMTYFGEAT